MGFIIDGIRTISSDRTPDLANNYDQAHTGYFNKGRLTEVITASVNDDSGTGYDDSVPETRLNYDFDLMGRTVRSSQTVGSNVYNLSYKYNPGGQLTQETYPSGRVVNLGYDDASRLSNLNSGQGHVYAEAFTYAGHGAISSFTLGNGATLSLGYGTNGRLQLSELTLAKNGTTLQKYEYKYGQIEGGTLYTSKNNGQLAQVESWIGTEQQYQQRYFYDTLGRLTESIEKYGTSLGNTAYDVKYKYDVFGNREQRYADNSGNTAITQKWVEAGDISTATNRYSSNVTYDAAGNITADPRFRNLIYGYDANGRQNYTAQANGSGPVTAVFDGAGQRVANKASGVLSIMVYDAGGKLVAQYGATAPTTVNLQYVTADYQGSTRVVTSSSGAVANRRDYLPFGEEIGASVGSRTTGKGFGSGDMVRQKYAGMETDDATNMAHTLWRKQDNFSGRWTSPDPYGGSMTIADPQSFNRYTYCENDPVNQVDSSGLMTALPKGYDREKKPVDNDENDNEEIGRVPGGDPHLSGSDAPRWDGGRNDRDNDLDNGKGLDQERMAYSGYHRVVKGDKVSYVWFADNVHDVPNDYVYIDTKGRVIRLWGNDDTNQYGWGVVEPTKATSSNQNGNGPEGPLFYYGVEAALVNAGYENFIDLLLDHILADNYAKKNGPTLHISLFSITGRAGHIGKVDVHTDQHSPVNQKCKHLLLDTAPAYLRKYAPRNTFITGPVFIPF